MKNQIAFKLATLALINVLFLNTLAHGIVLPRMSYEQEPTPLRAVAPVYPLIATATGVSGIVTVEAYIDQ